MVQIIQVILPLFALFTFGEGIFNPTRETRPFSYPFAGWIGTVTNRVKCGCTLINSSYILTAASCLYYGEAVNCAYFGYHNRSQEGDYDMSSRFRRVYIHPDFNRTSNDLALMQLSTPITDNGGIKSIPILTVGDRLLSRVIMKRCRVTGWGHTIGGNSSNVQSDVPLELVLRHRTGVCDNLQSSSLCPVPVRDSFALLCEGDEGAGYICKHRGTRYLAGVVSGWQVGKGCTPGTRRVSLLSKLV